MIGGREKILVIKLGAFGDFIIALGPMQAIRRHHPKAHITLLTSAPYKELGEASGLFDDIWIDPRPKWHQPDIWVAQYKKFNDGEFTRVYDLQNNDRTALYFRLFHPRPEWVGAVKGASHRNDSPLRSAGHAFDGHVQTLALAGIDDVAVDTLEWMQGDKGRFSLSSPYALIIPGAAPTRPLKKWPAEHYAELCVMIARRGIHPVLIGSHHEKEIAETITTLCPAAINLTEETRMTDIPMLARDAVFAVGNDTGPMHTIGPTGCKALVLFSADSNPVKNRPLGAHVVTLFEPNLTDLSVMQVGEHLMEAGWLPRS